MRTLFLIFGDVLKRSPSMRSEAKVSDIKSKNESEDWIGVTQSTVHTEIKMLRWYGPAERRDDVEERRTNPMDTSGKHMVWG
jgi:hypothetical protein